MSKFTGWIASLSNGDTVHQTEPVPGERTSWQRLLKRCRDNDIEIKRLALLHNDTQIMSINSKQCDGFFQAKEVHKHFFASMVDGPELKGTVDYQGIGSVIGDQVFIIWIMLTPTEHVNAYIKSDVRPLESCRIHTTLQEG